ncbi:amidohydrolase/deacetylase family metallohydrolase [Streptomyces sp. NPDC057565]|uniref:amidohydrolase/deacetylase family metallohydrolase n=1 Tax=Streptomyces sp. NPDC057565 TaxID=3346169 RepID=UPI003673E813
MHARDQFRRVTLPAALTLALGALIGTTMTGGASAATSGGEAAEAYDLVVRNGHVIDPKNHVDAVRDVAIKDGKIAKVAERIDASAAKKTVDASGEYVTPGLIDLHAHLFPGPENAYKNGWAGVAPDGFTFRSGVTTAVDTGSSGARSFDLFKKNVIDRSKTRVLAFLNIVGEGMAGGDYESDLGDMDPDMAAAKAKENPDTIVGIKTAHFTGPEWTAVENSVKAAEEADIPVMVDFGNNRPQRPLEQLLTEKLRPGDIYTHAYSGLRGELGKDGKLNPGMWKGRERGVLFDVGHGGGSFGWDVAIPAVEQGFLPDTISTDLHIDSMNSGMKDQSNVMSKMLTLRMPLKDVVNASTWASAKAIQRPELGNLSVGAPADLAVFTLEKGKFGFVDSFGWRVDGNRKLSAEVTVRAGKVVWDLNGQAAQKYTPAASRFTASTDEH